MDRPAKDGSHLVDLVQMAIAQCQAAQAACSRRGPGRPPVYEDWQIAVLIVVAISHKRKSKSSQWNFIIQHRSLLLELLKLARLPTRSTYFKRYQQIGPLYEKAIELQGKKALQEHVSRARVIAADKSLIPARGPQWDVWEQKKAERLPGTDTAAGWGCSSHDGWLWSYSYEVVVCATAKQVVFPLLASVHQGNSNEQRSLAGKIPLLPKSARYGLFDSGYDNNQRAEEMEYSRSGKRTGRRYLCPLQARCGKPAVGKTIQKGKRERGRLRRLERQRFYNSRWGRNLYSRRKKTVEPFNQWFKHLFELEDQVWHRGLDNNRTMLLAGIFCYQLLLRYSFRCGRRDGQIQWILDGL